MKSIRFESEAFVDFTNWSVENKAIFKKINELIKDIDRDNFHGIGKPDPLKHELKGWWSRRISEEDRLVYKIENEVIIISQCKGHY